MIEWKLYEVKLACGYRIIIADTSIEEAMLSGKEEIIKYFTSHVSSKNIDIISSSPIVSIKQILIGTILAVAGGAA